MGYEYDDLEDEKEWKKVRERNLKINVAKQLIIREITERKNFTRQELKDIFAFKESDILYIAPELFEVKEEEYVMSSELSGFIDKVIMSNKAVKVQLVEAEAEFIKI